MLFANLIAYNIALPYPGKLGVFFLYSWFTEAQVGSSCMSKCISQHWYLLKSYFHRTMFLSLVKKQDSKLKDTANVHIYFALPNFYSVFCVRYRKLRSINQIRTLVVSVWMCKSLLSNSLLWGTPHRRGWLIYFHFNISASHTSPSVFHSTVSPSRRRSR